MAEEKIPDIKIPESTLRTIKEAHESYKKISENLASMIPKFPKIDLPKFELPKILNHEDLPSIMSPEVVREQNSWERHKEMLDIQNALLGVQSQLLNDQKDNSKLSKWIFILTILSTIIAILSLVVSLYK
jgi:Mg2+ and Co2+ transporter CorA